MLLCPGDLILKERTKPKHNKHSGVVFNAKEAFCDGYLEQVSVVRLSIGQTAFSDLTNSRLCLDNGSCLTTINPIAKSLRRFPAYLGVRDAEALKICRNIAIEVRGPCYSIGCAGTLCSLTPVLLLPGRNFNDANQLQP